MADMRATVEADDRNQISPNWGFCQFMGDVCRSSRTIHFSPWCMAVVFGLMAALTFSISLTMFILGDSKDIVAEKKVGQIAAEKTYSMELDLDKLGEKKKEQLIILYGFKHLQQVKFFRYLDYNLLASISNDSQIATADNYAINTTFSDTVISCEYLDVNNESIGPCQCEPDSIVFPFADKLNANPYGPNFTLKYRLIDWVQIYPFRELHKHLCAIPAPEPDTDADAYKYLKITFSNSWRGWDLGDATQNVKVFFVKAVYPSTFGGKTDFLENLGFALAGVCAFIGIAILIFHHCCERNDK